jgi:hypothetical protein
MRTFLDNPSQPRMRLPAFSCDSHVHVFGPIARFPFSESIKVPPDDSAEDQFYTVHMQSDFLHTVGLELTKSVGPVVIDHMGRVDATLGRDHPHKFSKSVGVGARFTAPKLHAYSR